MKNHSILIYCTHGTYGRDDDTYGALLQANHTIARGMDVTLVLVEDGVLVSKKGQNPSKIGLPNNLNELTDLIELGGKLLVVNESLEQRGIRKEEIIDEAEIISFRDVVPLVENHDLSLTF
jgi:sulfur relay (sulfurtransferase) DsrF/TusC family protein